MEPKPNESKTINTKIVDWKLLKKGVTNGNEWSLYKYTTEGGNEIVGFADSHPYIFNCFEKKEPAKLFIRYNAERKSWNIVNPSSDRSKQKAKEFRVADEELLKLFERVENLESAMAIVRESIQL